MAKAVYAGFRMLEIQGGSYPEHSGVLHYWRGPVAGLPKVLNVGPHYPAGVELRRVADPSQACVCRKPPSALIS